MSLYYDKRQTGSRGRALRVAIPELALEAGFRLEPTPTMPDVGEAVDNNSTADSTLVFWDRSKEKTNDILTLKKAALNLCS